MEVIKKLYVWCVNGLKDARPFSWTLSDAAMDETNADVASFVDPRLMIDPPLSAVLCSLPPNEESASAGWGAKVLEAETSCVVLGMSGSERPRQCTLTDAKEEEEEGRKGSEEEAKEAEVEEGKISVARRLCLRGVVRGLWVQEGDEDDE